MDLTQPTNPNPTNGTGTATGQSGGTPDPLRPKRRRATAAEQAERLDLARRLLEKGFRKGKVKRALRKRFGPMSGWTCERILTLARPDEPRRTVAVAVAVIRCETGRVKWAERLTGPIRLEDSDADTLGDWCDLFRTTPARLAELLRSAGDGHGAETVTGLNPAEQGGT